MGIRFQNILVKLLGSTFESSYFRSETKFIFIATAPLRGELISLTKFFLGHRITNFIILYKILNPETTWKIFSFNQFTQESYFVDLVRASADVSLLFPDQLKNMKGYKYRAVMFEQVPRLFINGKGTWVGIDILMVSEILKHQNANIAILLMKPDEDTFSKALAHPQIDFTLNTAIKPGVGTSYRRFINTHDVNGFCALVPIPSRLSFLHFLLTPYDPMSWSFMALSTLICAVLWTLLSGGQRTSSFYFVFGIIANFLGQSIPFRGNRRMQMILLQLCIMMTFIMGNAYQSLIIASMTASREGIRFKTVSEMFNSDLKFKVDLIYYINMKASNMSSSILDRMDIAGERINYSSLKNNNYAVIARCDILEIRMKYLGNYNAVYDFYMLPEKLMTFYENFMLGPKSPLYDRLQLYNEYIFESGIRQYWKESLTIQGDADLSRREDYFKNEEYLLTMDDVYGTFYILLVGYAASFVVFLFEFFFNDFLTKLNFKKVKQFFMGKRFSRKRPQRVRRIQVKPIEI